jgi:hypothetical protein
MKHGFEFGARVIADGDATLPMVVTAFLYRPEGHVTAECSYLANGDAKAVWIESWRLTAMEAR